MATDLVGDICFLCRDIKNPHVQVRVINAIQPPIYHRFPNRPALRRRWMKICNIKPGSIDIHSTRICSNHFSLDDYVHIDEQYRLKPGSVPTIDIPSSLIPLNKEDLKIIPEELDLKCNLDFIETLEPVESLDLDIKNDENEQMEDVDMDNPENEEMESTTVVQHNSGDVILTNELLDSLQNLGDDTRKVIIYSFGASEGIEYDVPFTIPKIRVPEVEFTQQANFYKIEESKKERSKRSK